MKIDLTTLEPHREAGHIGTQRHPYLPLLIHNYTQRCQFDRAWNNVTLMCRGLITDDHGNVICRPFRKFFNLDEHTAPGSMLPAINWNQGFHVTEKLDGSLGVLYPTPTGPAIATRGSFVSDQAKVGTEILELMRNRGWTYNPRLTYLFEIIYPENRIVVDYGKLRDLILLDVLDTESGVSVSRDELSCHSVDLGFQAVRCHQDVTAEILASYETGEANREGIVVRFDDGTRVKIKFGEYKRLHRLITGLTARKIWECLSTGTPLDLECVPDEFFNWVDATKRDLLGKFDATKARASAVFGRVIAEIDP